MRVKMPLLDPFGISEGAEEAEEALEDREDGEVSPYSLLITHYSLITHEPKNIFSATWRNDC